MDDSPILTPEDVLAKVRDLRKTTRPRLVIIDHATTLVPFDSSDPDAACARLFARLRTLARQLGVALVVTSGVSVRCEWRVDKRPMLEDLPGSRYAIDRPDLVLLLHRDDVHNEVERLDELNVSVAANRRGRVGDVTLRFVADRPAIEAIPA